MGYAYQVNLIIKPDGSLDEQCIKAIFGALDEKTLSTWQNETLGIIALACNEVIYKTGRRTIIGKVPGLHWDPIKEKPATDEL